MQRQFLETGTAIGKYSITKALFMGGTGITYLALETGSRHAVVLKEYYPQDLESVIFRDENGLLQPAREEFRSLLQGKLNTRAEEEVRKNACIHFDEKKSTNVAGTYRTQIIPSEETGGIGVYLVIDTAAGETLAQWVEKNHKIEKFLEVTIRIAEKLQEQYHNRGYVHLDLRPENVYIEHSSDHRIVFLDLEYTCECNGTLQEVNAYPYSSGFSSPELKKLYEVQKSQVFTGFGSLKSDELDNAEEAVNATGFSIDTYSVAAMLKWMLADNKIPSYMDAPFGRFFRKALGKATERFESVEGLIGELNKLLLAIRQKGYEPEVLRYNAYRNLDEENIRIDPNLICQVKMKESTYDNLTKAVRAELLENNKQSCMVLSAEGGAGKSFALLNCVGDFRPDSRVYPFLIPARNLERESLLCYFAHTFAKAEISINQTEAELRFDSFLKQVKRLNGTALLLVDGLDELSTNKRMNVFEAVKLLAARNNCLKVVISSRRGMPGMNDFHALESSLLELPKDRLSNMDNGFLGNHFPLPITPLLIVIMREISSNNGDYDFEQSHIESKFDLMKAYFEALQRKAGAGRKWIYSNLLPYIAHGTKPVFDEKAFKALFSERNASYGDFIFGLDDLVDVSHFPVAAAEKALYFKQEAMSSGLIVKANLQYRFNHLEKRDYLEAVYMASMASTDDNERDTILTKMIHETAYYDEHHVQRRDLSEVDSSLTRGEYFFHILCESIDVEQKTLDQEYLSRVIELGLNLGYYLEGDRSYALSRKLDVLLELYKEYMSGNVSRILESMVYYYFMCLRIPQRYFVKEDKTNYLQSISNNLQWTLNNIRKHMESLNKDSSEYESFQLLEAQCLGNLAGTHLEKAKLLLNDSPKLAILELNKARQLNLEGIELKKRETNLPLYRNYVSLGTIEFWKARCYQKMQDNDNAKRCLLEAIDNHEKSLNSHLWDLTEGYRHVAYHNIGGSYRELCKIGSAEEQVVFSERALSSYEFEIQELAKRKEVEKSKVSIIREIEKLDVDSKAFFNEQPEMVGKRNEDVWRIFDDLKS